MQSQGIPDVFSGMLWYAQHRIGPRYAPVTEDEVRRFQMILRDQLRIDLALPEAWSRAIQLLDLMEDPARISALPMSRRVLNREFALPRS